MKINRTAFEFACKMRKLNIMEMTTVKNNETGKLAIRYAFSPGPATREFGWMHRFTNVHTGIWVSEDADESEMANVGIAALLEL